MKKIIQTCILAMILWAIEAEAQPTYKSTIAWLHSNTTNKVLVCQHQSRYVVTYHRNTNTGGKPHYFIVQDMLTGTTKQFPVDPYTSYTL